MSNIEKLSRDIYAADTDRASYYWSIQRHGLVVVEEYDTFGVLHKLSEVPPPPFILHAKPYRETSHPHFYIDIDQGMDWVFQHRVRNHLEVNPLHPEDARVVLEEAVIVGRQHPDGREDILLVYADGELWEFNSEPPGEHGQKLRALHRGVVENFMCNQKGQAALAAANCHKRS